MHKAVFIGVLAAGLAAPAASYAQPAAPAATADQIIVVRPSQWVAVGVGVVVGAAVADVLAPTNLGYIVGGIVGGYLANVWYNGRQIEINVGSAPKA